MSKIFSPKIPMQTARVGKIIKESEKVKTIELNTRLLCVPGQFLMVWIPGLGERPMSIGNNDPLTISIANVGKVSAQLHKLKKGDVLSFRGPLGNGFKVQDTWKRILVVGGGYGVVPLYFLARMATSNKVQTLGVIGARTAKDIIYEKKLYAVTAETFITTDDGSAGKKGTVMEEVHGLLDTKHRTNRTSQRSMVHGKEEPFHRTPDAVFACGPERMMLAVARECLKHEIPCQVSLERYMKCGLGVCGSCDLNGKTVCNDGPVFDGLEALGFDEFGQYKRDVSGKKVKI
jgi:dihydroorotate dehydrogenase electron transfer subunit